MVTLLSAGEAALPCVQTVQSRHSGRHCPDYIYILDKEANPGSNLASYNFKLSTDNVHLIVLLQ